MDPLTTIATAHARLSERELEHLHRLAAQWQLLADLSFADLLLCVADADDPERLWVAAQQRPTTGPTAHPHDLVGRRLEPGEQAVLRRSLVDGLIHRDADPEWRDGIPVRVEAIPVRRDGDDKVLAVVARDTNLLGIRTPSRLEITYLRTADDLASMIRDGWFPHAEPEPGSASPRVGDGAIRLDRAGVVEFASPNAQSAYRRAGGSADLTGEKLVDRMRTLLTDAGAADPDLSRLAAVASGKHAGEVEVETGSATLVLRGFPLRPSGEHTAALILLRDVTELRSRERELLTKDATIREIHHRVKNNLQTVAALLRLQARRTQAEDARAALDEAVQRVGSIAIVHETLSQSFDERVEFDQVADRVLDLVAAMSTGTATASRTGSFGQLPAAPASSLAMVLAELVQNAVEHGLAERGGRVEVTADRSAEALLVTVHDDGPGLPADFDPDRSGHLGLTIVRTLVTTELGGRVAFDSTDGGTTVRLELPIR